MKKINLSESFWGAQAKKRYLIIATIIMLFSFLGAREIWTQEHRWADIVSGMFYRGDFLHPYLGENRYYDKPLLSYWLVVAFTYVIGQLNEWALRLPSVLAGCLALFSIYRLGRLVRNRRVGFLAAWILLTTFYFVFWARVSSADMLNLGGSLFAIMWYMEKRNSTRFTGYAIFFLAIALTSLCKGLIGATVPVLAVLVDLVINRSWQKHINIRLFLALIPALVIYFIPFWLSSHFGGEAYGQSGLYLVYRENILRYFQPFDHKGPIYTYFIYLPIYLLPWTLFFIPALYFLKGRYKKLSNDQKWVVWTLAVLFLFFTLSGSRRSYYVLPMAPFAVLLTADWLAGFDKKHWLNKASAIMLIFSFLAIYLFVDVLPAWYYHQYGVKRFAQAVKQQANQIQPWPMWNVILLDGDSKLTFYLQLPPDTKNFGVEGDRMQQTHKTLTKSWRVMRYQPSNTIFITRANYVPIIEPYFVKYQKVQLPVKHVVPFVKSRLVDRPVAFIPMK